ncbi:hypothetical protein SKAU_G00298840 [Synaphobranchus kaupii]|uniref:Shugoshin C-terminal domain-containing protein n=1 Tax=Synaphobranchus kaupii TaxID=118154 RepID=A0A9Q1EVC0_SYNKA|nr:hypothetical protein SKAU_G00298840 [Synaphobranchus kaupii]
MESQVPTDTLRDPGDRSAISRRVAMVRERVQKKSYQQSLEDIKEKMKEKRNKRMLSVSAASRGLSKNKGQINSSSKPLVLKSVQVNNRALARALEEEKAKVRQAQGLILQMRREQQTLLLHLLLLKRKLHEHEERQQAAGEEEGLTQSIPQEQESVDPGAAPFTSSPTQVSKLLPVLGSRINPSCEQEPFRIDTCIEEPSQPVDEAPPLVAESLAQAALPRTVTARRRCESRQGSTHKRGRRSFCQRNSPRPPGTGEPELNLDLEPLPQEFGPAQQSTPEAPPPKVPGHTQQQRQRKPIASRVKPERGAQAGPRGSEEAVGKRQAQGPVPEPRTR